LNTSNKKVWGFSLGRKSEKLFFIGIVFSAVAYADEKLNTSFENYGCHDVDLDKDGKIYCK